MKIAVIGSGAIGNLVAAYLKDKGQDVVLIGRPETVKVIGKEGLKVSGVRGELKVRLGAEERLSFSPGLVILAVKTQDIAAALGENREFLGGSTVLTIQNGIQADKIAAEYVPKEKIISSIVLFGATYFQPGKVLHNFEGGWVIGRQFAPNDAEVLNVRDILSASFSVIVTDRILGMKYLKVFLNANNCIPAILGLSMQEAFLNLDISRISIAIYKEGLDIVSGAGVKLESLPDYPLERLVKLAGMPILEAAKIFSGIMMSLSEEPLYGSVLQSIKRGRPSEIDYINGEFLELAKAKGLPAPLNAKMVEMVHKVEKSGKFFTKEELFSQVKGWI